MKPLFTPSIAFALPIALALLAGCSSSGPAKELPPLADLDEPLSLMAEPDDEAARVALAPGGFTGIVVGDARDSLDALVGESEGLLVTEVVENSPAQAAGVARGDVLLAYRKGGREELLEWPSQWRALELETPAGSSLELVLDRAGREMQRALEVVPRVVAREREEAQRLREGERVGVTVRAATEVEARGAGMGPGSGAVIVGFARSSPWRATGLVYGDLIVSVDGVELAHPQALLDAIRAGEKHGALALEVLRDGHRARVDAPLSRREGELSHFKIWLLYSYEREPRSSKTSVLLGLVRVRRTQAAWDCRLLWFLSFGGGDANRLERVQ